MSDPETNEMEDARDNGLREAPMVREKVYTVGVIFQRDGEFNDEDATRYYYKADDQTIQLDDLVTVITPYGYSVVKVKEIHSTKHRNASKWIIQRVDLNAYETKRKNEMQITELKSDLQNRIETTKQKKAFESLVEGDNEAKELADRITALGGVPWEEDEDYED